MNSYQLRVKTEAYDLELKWIELGNYLRSSDSQYLSSAEKERMERQYDVMEQYLDILKERIEAFVL